MHNFKNFLNDINKNTKIPFKIITGEDNVLVDHLKNNDFIVKEIFLGNKKAKILIDREFKECKSLLIYSIEEKYKEVYSKRKELVNDIINGKILLSEDISEANEKFHDLNTLFLILVEENKYEILNALKEIYNKEEYMVILYKEYILILGNFKDIKEHAKSIKELINFDLYTNCYINYSKFNGFEELRKFFNKSDTCIQLCKSYGLKEKTYSSEDLLFEKSVFNINEEIKNEIYEKFKDKFLNFDNETINTIQQFINCDLNISKTAKVLYIHRNTLIYRLDKLQKDTSYDIRNFKQATIFIIAFLIWREKKIQ